MSQKLITSNTFSDMHIFTFVFNVQQNSKFKMANIFKLLLC